VKARDVCREHVISDFFSIGLPIMEFCTLVKWPESKSLNLKTVVLSRKNANMRLALHALNVTVEDSLKSCGEKEVGHVNS